MKMLVQGILVATSFLIMAGCAGRSELYAVKDGTTAEERVKDGAYCQAQLVQPEPLRSGNWSKRSFMETTGIEQRLRQEYIKCMSGKGYSIVTG